MSEIHDAACEVRDAVRSVEETLHTKLLDIGDKLIDIAGELAAMRACVRDISDVMHARYYGEKTQEETDGGNEE